MGGYGIHCDPAAPAEHLATQAEPPAVPAAAEGQETGIPEQINHH